MGFIDTGSIYAPVQKVDPGPTASPAPPTMGKSLTVYNLTNPGKEFKLFTNPANAFRDYNAFQLIGTKRYSKQLAGVGVLHLVARRGHGEQHRRLERRRHDELPESRPDRHVRRPEPSSSTPTVRRRLRLHQPGEAGWHVPRPGVRRLQRQRGLSLHHRAGVGTHRDDSRTRTRATRRCASSHAARGGPIRSTTSTSASRRRSRSAPAIARSASISTSSTSTTRASSTTAQRTGVIEASGITFGNPNVWISPRLARLGFRFTF